MVLKFNNSSDSLNSPLKKRLIESIGIVLLLFSIAIGFSLISFNINDPSFSYLSDNNTKNFLGNSGAYTSDLLIKLFGSSAIIIFLITFVWGVKFFIHKQISLFWIRFIFRF